MEIESVEDRLGKDGLQKDRFNYNLELYGEFVPSLFSWITPDEQMERVNEISEDVK